MWCRGLAVNLGGRPILREVDLSVEGGRSTAVLGPSGSGKTTLLRCLAGLVRPDRGRIGCGADVVSGASARVTARLRRERIGIVFQTGELLDELTVHENVALPLRLRRSTGVGAIVDALLERVGLDGRGHEMPAALSGGEVQRVGIARALVGEPSVVLADEPTGALDEELSATVAQLLIECARERGAAVVVATHDPLVAALVDDRRRLRAGRLEPA